MGKLRAWFTREGGADAMRPMATAMLADVPAEHGRTAYTVQPDPLLITVTIHREGRTDPPQVYHSLEEFAGDWGSRTRFMDPTSPEYAWTLRDLEDWQANGATMAGTLRPPGAPGGTPGEPAAGPSGTAAPAAGEQPGQPAALRRAADQGPATLTIDATRPAALGQPEAMPPRRRSSPRRNPTRCCGRARPWQTTRPGSWPRSPATRVATRRLAVGFVFGIWGPSRR